MTYSYNNSNDFEGSENDMVNSPAHLITATYAVSYFEEAICGIDKYIDISPTDDYKAQLIATKRLYGGYLTKLKEWLDSQEK